MAIDTNAPSYTYDKVICPHCRVETEFTPADLLEHPINKSIRCEQCGKVVISNLPQTKTWTQTGVGFSSNYEWD